MNNISLINQVIANYQQNISVPVLIVGGGISGLSLAWWLKERGIETGVWEKEAHIGGKIQTSYAQGYTTEQAASMVMNFRPEVDHFLKKSGLERLKTKRLQHSESKRYLLEDGQLQALPMTIGKLFSSPLWSLKGKLRLLLEPFMGPNNDPNETVSSFVKRRFGHEFLEKAMEPFIAGTLASNPDVALADYTLPRLKALEKNYGSITAGIFAHKILGKRSARFSEGFSFAGGMGSLCQQLSDNLNQDPKAFVQQAIEVINIEPQTGGGWQVAANSKLGPISCHCQHLVLATPAPIATKLCQSWNKQLSKHLSKISYAPVAVVHLGLKQKAIAQHLDSAGFLVPRKEKLGINGNLWMSSLFANRAPQGEALLSTYIGGSRAPHDIDLSLQQSVNQVMDNLRPILKISSGQLGEPLMAKIDRHQQGLPLYQKDYHQAMQGINEQLNQFPDLHIQANYIGGVSVRDRISQAKIQADNIVKKIHAAKTTTSIFMHKPEQQLSMP